MKPGQIAQLQELRKCYGLPRLATPWINFWLENTWGVDKMDKYAEADLRRLWHAYRGQIRQMRKNRARL
jgi:hypothetical protein